MDASPAKLHKELIDQLLLQWQWYRTQEALMSSGDVQEEVCMNETFSLPIGLEQWRNLTLARKENVQFNKK